MRSKIDSDPLARHRLSAERHGDDVIVEAAHLVIHSPTRGGCRRCQPEQLAPQLLVRVRAQTRVRTRSSSVLKSLRRFSGHKLRKSGLTLLMVEQKLDIALAFAQRAYVPIKGRVVLHDTTVNLARRSDLSDLYFSLATSSASSARSTV